MDTKYLTDIPNYHAAMEQLGLPRFQYTIRDESTGAVFVSYASELSKTYATLAINAVLAHLKAHGVDLAQVQVRTDLGSEFDGDTVHYREEGFHRGIERHGAVHRFNPPARPNANADVESFHNTVELEFFDIESFTGPAQFMAAARTYQAFFNFGRKNRSRSNKTPAQLLREESPSYQPPRLALSAWFSLSRGGSTSVWRAREVCHEYELLVPARKKSRRAEGRRNAKVSVKYAKVKFPPPVGDPRYAKCEPMEPWAGAGGGTGVCGNEPDQGGGAAGREKRRRHEDRGVLEGGGEAGRMAREQKRRPSRVADNLARMEGN